MSTATSITVRVPLDFGRRPGRKTVATPTMDGVAPVTTRADPALVKALARAFRYQRMLAQGRYASITEMAAAERLERGYLGSLLRLTLLAPDIVSAILDGRQSEGLTCAVLAGGVPVGWDVQRNKLGANNPESPDPPSGMAADNRAAESTTLMKGREQKSSLLGS
jgi:hypothetical protein